MTSTDGPLNNSTLLFHALSFKTKLGGDSFRGRPVAPPPRHNLPAGVGRLKDMQWLVLTEPARWKIPAIRNATNTGLRAGWNRGILIRIIYEGARYTAILLRSTHGDGDRTAPAPAQRRGYQDRISKEHYPILLTHMPDSIQRELVDYLADRFDALTLNRLLSPLVIPRILENYLQDIFSCDPDADAGYAAVMMMVKGVSITYGFYEEGHQEISPLTFDVAIPAAAIAGFLRRGHQHTQVDAPREPFLNFLAFYVRSHLGMDLRHPDVFVTKVICSGFELSTSRLKICRVINDDQAKAAEELLDSLAFYISKKLEVAVDQDIVDSLSSPQWRRP